MVWALITSYATAAAFAVVAVFVSTSTSADAIRESERESAKAIVDSQRKWCALLVPLDDNYKTTPPPTESGRRFAAIIHGLRVDFGCQEARDG